MKKLISFLLCIVASLMVVSCRKADIASPEKLITRPVINEEKSKIYEKIDAMIPASASIILPNNSTQIGKINFMDIDLDGDKEIIAFIKNERIGDPNQVGFVIYNYGSDKKITELYKYLTEGESIDFADFIYTGNKAEKDLIVLVRNKTDFEIATFGCVGKQSKSIEKLTDYKVQDSDVKILVADDIDKKVKKVYMVQDAKDYKAEVSLLEFDEESQLVKSEIKIIEDVKNIRDMKLSFGQIYKGVNAIIIDYPLQSVLEYQTQAFINKDGNLKAIFADDEPLLRKPHPIKIEDINGDGILDFPNIDNGISGKLSDTGDRYYSNIISWYNWNGQSDGQSSMSMVDKVYSNYNYNFRISIPKKLTNRIFIKQRAVQEVTLFDLYYIDAYDATRNKLYTLIIKSKTTPDDNNKAFNFKDAYKIKESVDYSFGIVQQNKQLTDKLNFDMDELSKSISLIYE